MNLFEELKRRKVVKVIILYSTTAFILLQVVSLLIEPLLLPKWVMTFFILLLIVGFPVAVIFSWIFDITPEGIKITASSHSKKSNNINPSTKNSFTTNIIMGILIFAVIILAYPKVFNSESNNNLDTELEKSIAVLPFIDDSPTEGNTYIINGLMESILNNLTRIKDLKVTSRTSVEKYRDNPKLIAEMANELKVNYIVEGSGQKIDDKILLTIQLIDAKNDEHLWSNQYIKEATDILNLQVEVAKSISQEIQAIITPEEENRINKLPTENTIAYDYFLKGLDRFQFNENRISEDDAILYFEKAIELDPNFALPHAALVSIYEDQGDWGTTSKNSTKMNWHAEKAMLIDPFSERSLIAKALYYMDLNDYITAIPYLEKVLDYNPNSYKASQLLGSIYSFRAPNTELNLEYALIANKLNPLKKDNIDLKANLHERLSQALRYSGFFDEATYHANKSLDLGPNNPEFINERAQLYMDMNQYNQAKKLLLPISSKRTSSFAFTCYLMRDYTDSQKYYLRAVKSDFLQKAHYGRLAYTFLKLGNKIKYEEYLNLFEKFIGNLPESNSGRFHLKASLYSVRGESKKALEQMKILSETKNYNFWIIRLFKDDPMYDNIRNLPEFKEILGEIESKFWKNHEETKSKLKKKGLI